MCVANPVISQGVSRHDTLITESNLTSTCLLDGAVESGLEAFAHPSVDQAKLGWRGYAYVPCGGIKLAVSLV